MEKEGHSGTLAVILHADVAGSTALVQQDKQIAHERIHDTFQRFSTTIDKYQGYVLELRGDALLAKFERASDAVTAAISFQVDHAYFNDQLKDDLRATVRVGISMGEVIVADSTVTGAGVVQAQRVEQLANPGGVCITAAIHEALSKQLPFDLENLGEQKLKGFDHPVSVYQVKLRPGESIPTPVASKKPCAPPKARRLIVALIAVFLVVAVGAAYLFTSRMPQVEAASVERMAFPLPDKPSIAVLPFTNMSNDTEQEFFADGMTEDLITDISKVSGVFVIARNSVFTYKGKAVKVRQVAEELGVRYVMEGSVRRAGNQVRINAQLIDAITGGHIWAERYDGSLDDVFSMQDKITKNIVTSLSIVLTQQDRNNRDQNDATNPEAYDAFLLGWEHFKLQTPGDFASARDYFERAIAIDPQYSRAYAALAALYWETRNREWSPALGIDQDTLRQGAIDYLAKADADTTVIGLMTSSKIHLKLGKDQTAIRAAEQAIQLAPNDAEAKGNLAEVLIYSGRPDLALEHIVQALRLDPLHQAYLYYLRGLAEFGLENYATAAKSLSKALELNPDYRRPAAILAASNIFLGRSEDAATALEIYLSEYDGWFANVSSMMSMFFPYKQENDRTRLSEGLRRAGIPADDTTIFK